MTNPGQLKYKKLGSGAGEKIVEKENDEKKTLTYQVLCLVLLCKYGFIEGERPTNIASAQVFAPC